jgi:hypothetical protein
VARLPTTPLSELRLTGARFVLGLVHSWDLPPVADRALAGGVYSPALAELCEVANPIMSDVGPLFTKALAELNLPLLSRSAAAWLIARDYMERIAFDAERPREALRLLKRLSDSARDVLPDRRCVGDGLDVGSLIGIHYLYSEPDENYYDGRLITDEQERQSILDSIARKEASAWLSRHPTGNP